MNKINVTEVFSAEELALMEAYRANCAKEDNYEPHEIIPFASVLDKVYATEKYDLYKAFGNQMIRSVEYHDNIASDRAIERSISDLFEDDCSALSIFYQNIYKASLENLESSSIYYDGWNYKSYLELIHYNFINARELSSNSYSGSTFIIPADETHKEIKVETGSKVVKVLGKIAERYNIPGFEEFRLEHSRCLNSAKLEGQLCFSIHPLDFITMSENDNKWESCMNWSHQGCYRMGTVEMMNSPFVVVAYIASKKNMTRFGYEWNNKRWRQLFVVTPEVIAGIKAYPYYHEDLSKFAAIELAKILNETGAHYDLASLGMYSMEEEYRDMLYPVNKDNTEKPIEFYTQVMYNDFGLTNAHACVFNEDYNVNPTVCSYDYSGATQCVWCGKRIFNTERDDEGYLIIPGSVLCCEDCGAPTKICPACGHTVREDQLIKIDGEVICEDCRSYRTAVTYPSGETHLIRDNTARVQVIDDNGYNLDTIYLDRGAENEIDEIFGAHIEVSTTRAWFSEHIIRKISYSDLSEEGKEWYDRVRLPF